MRKLKRALSFIIAAAMILSLMPTFAMAATENPDYAYKFNPLGAATGTHLNTYTTYESTNNNWQWVTSYNTNASYPRTNIVGTSFSGTEIRGASTKKVWWFAVKIKVPSAGTYNATLDHAMRNVYGRIDVYVLPKDVTTLSNTADIDFNTVYPGSKLNDSAICLYAAEDAWDETAGTDKLNNTFTTVGNDEERILVIECVGAGDGTTGVNTNACITSFNIIKSADSDEGGETPVTQYTVTYNYNDDGATANSTVTVDENSSVTLPTPTREGYTFNGWSDGTGTYQAGASYTVTSDVTFTAQWTEVVADVEISDSLAFNSTTVSAGADTKDMSAMTATDKANFSIVAGKTMGVAAARHYQRSNAVHLLYRKTTTGKNWLSHVNDESYTDDNNAGRLTIQANHIPAGTYKVDLSAIEHARGAGVYLYVGGKYVGVRDTYDTTNAYSNGILVDATTETIGYVTISDSDDDATNANPVEISICSANIDSPASNNNIFVLTGITFEQVENAPAVNTLSYSVKNADGTAATANTLGTYEVENGSTLNVSAMLDGKHLNGYTVDGAEDTQNYIRVKSNNANVTVTDTKAALTSASIVASDYQPVYTVKALKSNAQATITVEAIVGGEVAASKSFAVSVAASDLDYFEDSANYAYGANYSELNSYVSVGSVAAGNIGSDAKGKELALSAEKEVVIEDATYKFVGWKRGGAGAVTDALSFTSYISSEAETTFTLWSNTYLTAVYDKVDDTAEQTVEFYNQDGTFLDSATAAEVQALAEIPEVSLLGHTFEKWQYIGKDGKTAEFTTGSELHEAVTRVVAKQNPKTVTITFADGTYGEETVQANVATETFNYGDAVKADDFYTIPYQTENPEELTNACWYRDGLLAKTYRYYSFYAWADTIVTPEFMDSVPSALRLPKVIVDTKANDGAYMIEWDCYSNATYTIVEAGILFSNTAEVTLSKFSGEKFTSQRNVDHGQFAAKPRETYDYARGYVIYKNETTDVLGIAYSNDVVIGG